MALPPGPATPGSPISFDDLRSQPYIAPNTDIGLDLMGTYEYDDGYIENYTFYGTYYPIPNLHDDLAISYFYDIDTEQYCDFYWSSGSPPWVTDVQVVVSKNVNLYAGGNSGPNVVSNPVAVENFGGSYGTRGGNIQHYYNIDVQINVTGMPPPSPPNPPSTPVNAEYKLGSNPWTAFPGSPSNVPNPSFSVQNLSIANSITLYTQVY